MKVAVTGGAGFIGSALVRYLIANTDVEVAVVDKLTYAGNLQSLASIATSSRYSFHQIDICDGEAIGEFLGTYAPDAIMHLAAESHVDRSIDAPAEFIATNVVGTYQLLQQALGYWRGARGGKANNFRFLHVSTDEVYGDLAHGGGYFVESTPYAPSSPYAATKAGSDHLVRAWGRTFELPVVITNCSNNYGGYQFPEKLIPHMILNALEQEPLPVYGNGSQIRDWLYVDDHAEALWTVVSHGKIGETYNIGGSNEQRNIDVVRLICRLLAEALPGSVGSESLEHLIEFVEDRPGHDTRYAIDAGKIHRELGWRPRETFESGLQKTVEWYLNNRRWWQGVLDGSYQLQRLGNGSTR